MDQKILFKYFKGNTTHEEEKQILDWVESSDENRKQLQKERLFFDISNFSEPESQKANLKHRIYPALKWSMGIAAAVLVLLSCHVLLREYVIDNAYANLQTVTVPAGQRVQIVLADGTMVWLNSQSTLTYQADFGRKNRNVTLDGEAFFNVQHNADIPFNVNTQHNQVRVVGTQFNVCAYNNTNSFETSLVEGIVDIYNADNTKEPLVRLHKDEMLVATNGVYRKNKISSYDFLRWKEGIYCFDDMPFSDVLSKLEKYYNIKITVENQSVLGYRCTGKFKERDGIEHILRVVQKDLKFKFITNSENNTIVIK